MQDTYKTILDSYAKRLISTNSRTRTIYYSKNNKYIIDVARYMKKVSEEELKKFFCSENGLGTLKLAYGGMSTSKANEMFDLYINKQIDEEYILEKYRYFTKEDFSRLKKEGTSCYIELYNKHERLKKKEFHQLFKVSEENESIIKQIGKDDLYIGYPYIQGRFNKDKVVRAPLMLHKINMTISGENVIINNVGTKILNPVFIMSYLVENEITYKDSLDFEIVEDDYMPVVDKIFKNIGIKYVNNVFGYAIQDMKDLTKAEFKETYNYVDNNFEIINGMTIGIFPISDKKIYDDVKDLRDSEEINKMLNAFYDKGSDAVLFEDKVEDVNEKELKYITVLDYSQKKTLQEALNKNCIIQGPPGTGKSQVISNIAANLLLNRRNTLFCSEKRTATDVIYNRLGKLNAFALLLHDHVSEKNYFYDSIVKAVETAKDNIDRYKKKSFNFNQDYKIESFFNNSKKYNSVVNGEYHGLTFREVMVNKDKELLNEEIYERLSKLVKDEGELETLIYKYEASDLYQTAIKWQRELEKEYYSKYKLKTDKLLKINEVYKEVNECKNNYVKNNKVNEFVNDVSASNNFFKKIFNKNIELEEYCKDFLDESKHDFTVFSNVPFKGNDQKDLFVLKFEYNLSNEDILNNYIIYISKKVYKDIDLVFATHYTSSYDELMKEAFENMDSKREDSIEFIARSCSADIKEKLSSSKYNDQVQKLLGEINKKRKPPIKVIIDKYFEILQIIFPIWIMTPDVVSAVIPLREGIFDKVIFDEASQLFIEKAIPAIARSNSVVICGDSKQLRPTLFFESRYDETEEDIMVEVEQESALTENSLLDYATTSNKYVSSMLQYHYRCYYKELINFSNYAFYNGDLVFATNIKGSEILPIETINVDGKWDGQTNMVEATRVVELVKNLLVSRKKDETIGIITLNVNQRDLILDLFEDECKKDKEFATLYRSERERKDPETTEDESIFVKNLESVQGDERDIIIFSISYAKNEKGKIGSSLGEIQRQYGENRLNVAISRAKKKIYIIKSFMGEELTVNDSNKGPSYFKKYLRYADNLNNYDSEASKELLNSLLTEEKEEVKNSEGLWLEEDVYNHLIKNIDTSLYEIRRGVEIGSFIINLAIYDKETNMLLFGIECSGVKDYSNEAQVSDDIYRHYYLQIRGWDIYKLWITDWFNDKDGEIKKISDKLNGLKEIKNIDFN